MYEVVSVDQAINRGMKIVVVPAMLVMIAIIFLAMWLVNETAYFKIGTWLGIITGFFGGLIYWSMMSTRWRLWAFDNVRNVHELDKRAADYFIIGWAGLEKLEYQTAKQKQRWAELQQKFHRLDIFIEDFTIPDETKLPFSKTKAIINFVLGALIVCFGPYLYFDEEPGKHYKVAAVFFVLFGGCWAYTNLKKYNSTQTPITLSNTGIEKSDGKYYTWQEIRGENTRTKYHHDGNGSKYLVFNSPDGLQEINIDDLSIRQEKLDHLLRIYRGRFEHRQQQLRNRS